VRLYLIRHAQSTNNALPTPEAERSYDPNLTEIGFKQAQHLADYIATERDPNPSMWRAIHHADNTRGFGITKLYCSAMWRSLLTAKAISEAIGITPEIWLEIHEHGGIYLEQNGGFVGYPGKTRQEILQDFPNFVLPQKITDNGWWTEGYEDQAACHVRAGLVAQELQMMAQNSHRDECVALVTHGNFLDCLLKALLMLPTDAGMYFSHFNTSITRVEFTPDADIIIRYQNRVNHLPEALIT
jgi:2,3-bisphosphoglycerate-dependent phosphoglycerate mutase/probable phosphoglycerate mutase